MASGRATLIEDFPAMDNAPGAAGKRPFRAGVREGTQG